MQINAAGAIKFVTILIALSVPAPVLSQAMDPEEVAGLTLEQLAGVTRKVEP